MRIWNKFEFWGTYLGYIILPLVVVSRGVASSTTGERGCIAFQKLYSGTANLSISESKITILTSLGVDDIILLKNPFESV